MSHPPYHTFRESLAIKYPDCGHALWEPNPGGLYDAVEVGDVGFIRKGCFHRLFNVFLPADHPSHQNFGVPEHHEPFLLNAPTLKYQGTEGTMDFCSRHVSLSRDCDIYASGPDDDSQVTVSCPGKRGAMLSLPVPARREDTIALGDFGRWMIKYIDHWFAFAENLGLGINHMQDIILVTGCHRAQSWVNIAFPEGSRDAEVSFGVQLSGASSSNVKIRQRRAHGDVVLKLGPNGENLPDNQCIFLRGFRVARILNIWPRLRAEAGPAPDEGDHEPEPDRQLETIGISNDHDIDYQDPLHVLLQYIAESAPGCDMALVHDDDLACIVGASPDNLQPDAVIEHLRSSEREIWQIQCSSFRRNESGARAVGSAQVAMLSRDENWGRAKEQSFAMLALQKELGNVREEAQRARDQEVRRAQQDEVTSQILRERCERLEEELTSRADSEVVEQLRSDMEDLIAEVSDLSRRNDELMTSKDCDLTVIRDLDSQLKEYKRKYEQAKTELRSVKATSALFLQKPKFDYHLPVSADGAIPDVHLSAFLTAIDSLVSAGRSNAPTRVLTPMKSVVNAVTNILDDVRSHPRQQSDPGGVQALEERVEATLSNLVAASKTHATSSGLSPVGLLDAAVSHVSAAVTELGRVVLLRYATKAEQGQLAPLSVGAASSGFTPRLRTIKEVRPSFTYQRGPSGTSLRRGYLKWEADNEWERPAHSVSSSDDDSFVAPIIFDNRTVSFAGTTSSQSESATTSEESEDAWTGLRSYLEAQTEAIIYATQGVLSGVRSPTPSPRLNEKLTQIITIVSDIVAVCRDNLPAGQTLQGGGILRELSEQANKLSEVQALPEVTKESRRVMAKSSLAIANGMKMLHNL